MKLSAVIIAKNDEEVIKDCFESLNWADEIILIDTGSTDKTPLIAKKFGAEIISFKTKGLEFARWRNLGKEKATGDWILYVDTDERVTPQLKEEIKATINSQLSTINYFSAYELPRRNFFLGREMRHGGAWPDYVKRLYKKDKLKRWTGKLHEDPIIEGKMGRLKNPLIHLAHQDLTSMLNKTIAWSKIEADLLYKARHPRVTWWRFLRIMLTEFWERGIKKQGWRGGTEGWIEVIFQMFSRFITYARLWERQNKGET